MYYAFNKKLWAEKVHMMRFSMGWGVRELSAEIGMSIGTISRWERQESQPPVDVFLYVCNQAGWEPMDFIKMKEIKSVE